MFFVSNTVSSAQIDIVCTIEKQHDGRKRAWQASLWTFQKNQMIPDKDQTAYVHNSLVTMLPVFKQAEHSAAEEIKKWVVSNSR